MENGGERWSNKIVAPKSGRLVSPHRQGEEKIKVLLIEFLLKRWFLDGKVPGELNATLRLVLKR